MHDQEYVHINYIARLVPQYGNVQRIILAPPWRRHCYHLSASFLDTLECGRESHTLSPTVNLK